jgi:signal transduction histidine kinase
MKLGQSMDMEVTIASCRVVLSVCAIVGVYLDPMPPELLPGLGLGGGGLSIDPLAASAMGAHLLTSLVVWGLVRRRRDLIPRIAAITTWTDVLFAAAIAGVTEGTSSPFYAFFVFAVTATGMRGGTRRAAAVIVVAIALYLSLILVSSDRTAFFVMRPAYLGIVGYLIARLGKRRVDLEGEVLQLEAEAERSRIAAALHDGSLQALVGVQLRLGGCRTLVHAGRHDDAVAELRELEQAITREHDDLRRYVRDLARVGPGAPSVGDGLEPHVSVRADFGGPAPLVDEVLSILREALANVRRHARAHEAGITVSGRGEAVTVRVDDDGIGIPPGIDPPWSIASRVRAIGGGLQLETAAPGAHLRITLPVEG